MLAASTRLGTTKGSAAAVAGPVDAHADGLFDAVGFF